MKRVEKNTHRMNDSILVAEDEENMRKVLKTMLEKEGYEVYLAADGEDAKRQISRRPPSLVLTDLIMPRMNGMELLYWMTKTHSSIPVIILTAYGTIDTAVEALKRGAFDYITKPFDQQDFLSTIKKAILSTVWNIHGVGEEKEPLFIIGRSPEMVKVYNTIEKVAQTNATVLITGETGTGKELVARSIHMKSKKARGPFIHVNCAAIPESLIESELFGYERGAFTGAVARKPGRFELANGGTIFLDEVGDISREMQVKLLHVLQEGKFERVGGIETIHVDIRLIAATNKDLRREVEDGRFREDLFYRINVVPLHVPPLRERKNDIPLLVNHFIEKFNVTFGKRVSGVSARAMNALMEYKWPGNIRELENVMERLVLMADEDEIKWQNLPEEITGRVSEERSEVSADEPLPLRELVKEKVKQVESDIILETLDKTGWNVTRTAKSLGISRRSLQLKMKKYGLRKERNEPR